MSVLEFLLIEDSEDDALLVMGELRRRGHTVACHRVDSRDDLLAALTARRWPLIVSDFGLPGFSGSEALEIVRAHDAHVPFIVVSGTIGEEMAVDLMRAGANDYVLKDRLGRLGPAVARELRQAAGRKQRSELADEVLRSEERFRATFENAPVGIANGSAAGILLRVNQHFCDLLGYSAAELLGRPIWRFSHPDDVELGRERQMRVTSGASTTETFERRYIRKNGEVMWANVTLAAVRDASGALDYVIGLVTDVTGQRQVGERLRFQARLLDSVEEAVVATDLSGRVQYWNHYAEKLYGIARAEAMNRRVLELVQPELDNASVTAVMSEMRLGVRWSGEFFVRTRDGRRFPVALTNSPVTDDSGATIGVVGVSTDITRRYAADQALRESQAQLAMAQQFIRVGSAEHDLITGRRSWSDEMFRLYGLEVGAEPPPVKDVLALIDEEDRAGVALDSERALREMKPFTTDYRVTLPDGRRRELRSRVTIVKDLAERPAKLLGVVQDVTEQKALERELLLHGHRHEAIASLSRDALGGSEIEQLLASAEALVRDVLGCDFSEISAATASGLLLRAGHGWRDGLLGTHVSSFDLRTPAGYALSWGEMVVIEDSTTDDRFVLSDLSREHSVSSGLTVPIPGQGGKPWGVLGAYDASPRVFSADDMNFVRTVANILGSAMQRKRFEEELHSRARQQSAIAALGSRAVAAVDEEIINHACALLREVLSADHAFLLALDPERGRYLPCGGNAWLPAGLTIPATVMSQAGYTAHIDGPVVVADYRTESRFGLAPHIAAHGLISGVSVPVRVDGATFGVMGVQTRAERQFTEGDVHFIEAMANVVADVVQRERSRRALLDSEARYRTVSRELHLLLHAAEEGVYAVRLDGTCRIVNPAAARILGYTPEELLGRNLHDLIHSRRRDGTPYPESECPMRRVAADGQTRRALDETFWHRDGSPVSVEYAAAAIVDEGTITGVVVTFTDVSERRKMEARLEQATRVNSLGHLAATMAHEFNNVLMGISPFLDLLNRTEDPSPRLQMATTQMGKAVRRGKSVTEEILRFTRTRPPVFDSVGVEEWLRSLAVEAESILGDTYRLDVFVDSPALRMSADGNQLQQSILNLVVNARDAMPDGGRIALSARRDSSSSRYPFGVVPAPHSFVHFSISDEGCGMNEETLRQIFEPLFTTKRNGTGLGLAVTHQVVERHGGHIFVESTLGVGTTFHLFIPTPAGVEEAFVPAATVSQALPAGGRVLLVEDDEAVASGVTTLLEMEGIRVTAVSTAAEVAGALRANHDAVILDVGLPDGDGARVYEMIAAAHPDLPVIFSTGHGDEQKLDRFLARENVRFIMKPYAFSALLNVLASVGVLSVGSVGRGV